MIRSPLRVLALGAAAIAACSTAFATDLYPRLRPKPQRSVPITVPIGCLLSVKCSEGGFEGAAKGSTVTAADIARGGASAADRTSSDAKVYGVNDAAARAEALKFLIDVRDELRNKTPQQLLSRKDRPAGQRIIGPAPEALRMRTARYIAGRDFFNCKTIFVAMQRATEKVPAGRRRSDLLWGLYPHYIDSCYRGKLEALGKARDRIVIFLRKDPLRGDHSLYCLGFNFAANLVLTARHCLVETDEVALMLSRYTTSDDDAFIDIEKPLSGTQALVLGEPDKLHAVRLPAGLDQEHRFFPFEPMRDTFIVELDAPERPAVPAFPVAVAGQWDEIAIPAIFADDGALSDAVKSGDGERVTSVINGASAVDESPLCSLVFPRTSSAPFVFHGCQTRYGYSGGPILRRGPRGALALIGVHTGMVDAKKPINNWPYTIYFPNYGLRLPPQVLNGARAEARRQ